MLSVLVLMPTISTTSKFVPFSVVYLAIVLSLSAYSEASRSVSKSLITPSFRPANLNVSIFAEQPLVDFLKPLQDFRRQDLYWRPAESHILNSWDEPLPS